MLKDIIKLRQMMTKTKLQKKRKKVNGVKKNQVKI